MTSSVATFSRILFNFSIFFAGIWKFLTPYKSWRSLEPTIKNSEGKARQDWAIFERSLVDNFEYKSWPKIDNFWATLVFKQTAFAWVVLVKLRTVYFLEKNRLVWLLMSSMGLPPNRCRYLVDQEFMALELENGLREGLAEDEVILERLVPNPVHVFKLIKSTLDFAQECIPQIKNSLCEFRQIYLAKWVGLVMDSWYLDSVWPDLTKFCHFGTILKVLGNLWGFM